MVYVQTHTHTLSACTMNKTNTSTTEISGLWKYCNYPLSKTHSCPPLRAQKQHHSRSRLQEHQVTPINCLWHLLALQSHYDTAALKSRPSPGFPCSGHANTPPAISGLNGLFWDTQCIHSTLEFQSKKKAKYCGRQDHVSKYEKVISIT